MKATTLKRQFLVYLPEQFRVTAGKVKPLKGGELHKNFPNCCDTHKDMFLNCKEWFARFPNCCEIHRKLGNDLNFKKEEWEYVPLKVIGDIEIFRHFVNEMIDHENWFDEIIDFYNYCYFTYGEPSIGLNKFTAAIVNDLANSNDRIADYKRKAFEDYFQEIKNYSNGNNDLSVLINTFQEWVNDLPNVLAFGQLKEYYKAKFALNIIIKNQHYNKYIGQVEGRLVSKKELIEKLIKLTKDTIKTINTPKLLNELDENGINELQIEFITEGYNAKQKKLLEEAESTTNSYLKIISDWLEIQKDYINDIKPLLVFSTPKKPKQDLTPLQLFRGNQKKLEQFKQLLKDEGFVNDKNEWTYSTKKNTIVACFEALKNLEIVLTDISKSELQRIAHSLISFESSDKLFRTGFSIDDLDFFDEIFSKKLF